jgi:hypothetical protein
MGRPAPSGPGLPLELARQSRIGEDRASRRGGPSTTPPSTRTRSRGPTSAGMAAALHRDQDIARLPELRRIMELEADRGQTIAPPGATRGPGISSPSVVPSPSWPQRSGPKLTP